MFRAGPLKFLTGVALVCSGCESPLAPVPREILANQPDFIAHEEWSGSWGREGARDEREVAKRGKWYCDTDGWSTRCEAAGERTAYGTDRLGKAYQYTRPRAHAQWYEDYRRPQLFASRVDVALEASGMERVNGHECVIINAVPSSPLSDGQEDARVTFYAATDLKYLVIKAEATGPDRHETATLSNISFEVPEERFFLVWGK